MYVCCCHFGVIKHNNNNKTVIETKLIFETEISLNINDSSSATLTAVLRTRKNNPETYAIDDPQRQLTTINDDTFHFIPTTWRRINVHRYGINNDFTAPHVILPQLHMFDGEPANAT